MARIRLDLQCTEQPDAGIADRLPDLVIGPGMRVLRQANAVQAEAARLFDKLFRPETAVPAAAGCVYVKV
jgi:hypothetical protein